MKSNIYFLFIGFWGAVILGLAVNVIHDRFSQSKIYQDIVLVLGAFFWIWLTFKFDKFFKKDK